MKVGDLVRFRGNTVHGDHVYLVVSIDTVCRPAKDVEFARMMGQGPTSECVMVNLQYPTYRLKVVHPGRPAVE